MYTNSWDPNNGQILISTDQGSTFTPSVLPFKVGGNMPGRGMGEVYSAGFQQFSQSDGHDYLTSYSDLRSTPTATTSCSSARAAETVSGSHPTLVRLGPRSRISRVSVCTFNWTWCKARLLTQTSAGTYVPDPTDTSGYNNDIMGLSWVTFDTTSGSSGKATPRIFVGVANKGSDNIFVSSDAGATCKCSAITVRFQTSTS